MATSQRRRPAIGYPVTVKSLGLLHKSDAGGVVVGVADEEALVRAVASMPATPEGTLVESTVSDVVAEMLVSVRRDPPVGWLVTLGPGGVMTELLRDTVHLLAPVTIDDVRTALTKLRTYPVLDGFRGRPAADIDALAALVVRLADAVVGDTSVVEVELNPVLVGRDGAVAVDALWIETETETETRSRRRAMTDGFHVRRDGPIVEITIDRPKANAIDGPTSRALGAAFVELDEDPDVRVAILTGAGTRFFSAGWDLAAAAGGESFDDDWGAGGFGGFPELPDRRTPVIAAVNGLAVGGGFEIAMAADLVVAAAHAEFFLSEARLGILPDAGTVRLPRLLPRHVATRAPAHGPADRCDGEAAGWGLVNRVVSERRAPCRGTGDGRADRGRGTVGGRRHPRHRPTCGATCRSPTRWP